MDSIASTMFIPDQDAQQQGAWVWVPLLPAAAGSDSSAGVSPDVSPLFSNASSGSTSWGMSPGTQTHTPIDPPLFPQCSDDAAADTTLQSINLFDTIDWDDLVQETLSTVDPMATNQWMDANLGSGFPQMDASGGLLWDEPFQDQSLLAGGMEFPLFPVLPESPESVLSAPAVLSPAQSSAQSASPPSVHSPTRRGSSLACPTCSREFPTSNKLRKHQRTHTRPFVCGVCQKSHAAKKDLHRHLWTTHPDEAAANGVPNPVRKCGINGCTFEGRQDNLTRHIRTKHR